MAQEVAKYNVKVTIVEPGVARAEFRYGSAKVAKLTSEYDHDQGFLNILAPSKGLALGSQALKATIERLEERVAAYKTQSEKAASTDITEKNIPFPARCIGAVSSMHLLYSRAFLTGNVLVLTKHS